MIFPMAMTETYFFATLIAAISAVDITVNTTSGVVMGTEVKGTDVVKFMGIPYGEPTSGERRFKPPVKKVRMTEIFDATVGGYSCPQIEPAEYATIFNFSMNEDCLNLNMFVPAHASKLKPLPVMVWVYGGAYIIGAAGLYDATILSGTNDVIVVVINYRLGILGFLNTEDENSVGNFGLRDQCLALQWVKENIEEFGGNASSVTIFGESAGGASVTQLTMASSCRGLFHRVIAQSGSPLAPWAHNLNPLISAKELGENVGCPVDKTGALVECLRGKSIDELLKEQIFDVDFRGNPPSWVPSYTNNFFSFVPKELPLWEGIQVENKMNQFDFMTGTCLEEGELCYDLMMEPLRASGEINDRIDGLPAKFLHQILTDVARDALPGNTSRAEKLISSLLFQYTDWKNPQNTFTHSKMLVEVLGDTLFHMSTVQYARLHAELASSREGDNSRTGHTYFYRLKPRGSWLPSKPWIFGATHVDDLAFMFGGLLAGITKSTAEEKHLSQVMMEYWTNFAKTGNPNEPSKRFVETEWPMYTLGAEDYIELDLNMTADSTDQHPYARRVAFWDEFIPAQVKMLSEEVEHKPCDTYSNSTETLNMRGVDNAIVFIAGFILILYHCSRFNLVMAKLR